MSSEDNNKMSKEGEDLDSAGMKALIQQLKVYYDSFFIDDVMTSQEQVNKEQKKSESLQDQLMRTAQELEELTGSLFLEANQVTFFHLSSLLIEPALVF
jgi:2-phospho-L-lactate transferase/gluconeogenesis factor (CofD/UPF0052 family)